MFDKIKGAFEIYSQSYPSHKDPTLRTVSVKIGVGRAQDKIIEMLKSLKYKEIRVNDSYNEIFTSKAGYEVTIILVAASDGNTSIDITVYAPEHRGKTRKALRYLLNKTNEVLNSNEF